MLNILALPKGQAFRYIFFWRMRNQKKDAASILNAKPLIS